MPPDENPPPQPTPPAHPPAMPLYLSHKEVRALKIKEIREVPGCGEKLVEPPNSTGVIVCGEPEFAHTPEAAKGDVGMDHAFTDGGFLAEAAMIVPEDTRYAPFGVSVEYMRKHQPQAGGYYVVYDGGYESWSPADVFDKGYTLIKT